MSLNKQIELKAEQIAYMMVVGLTKAQISKAMDMTYTGLDRIMSTPEYLAIEERVRAKKTKHLDNRLEQALDKRFQLSQQVESAVEEAIHVLLRQLREKKDLRAALEILDRDPKHQFGKASRSAIETTNTGSISSEALATAVKEADVTQKMLQAAEQLTQDQPLPEA